jgi:hypothetical protein
MKQEYDGEGKSGSVDLEQVSKPIFGISSRRYRQLADEGRVPFAIRGKIPLLPAIKGLIEYYRNRVEEGECSLEGEKALKLSVERRLRDLKYSIRTGELIVRSDISKMFSERERVVAAGLTSLWRSLSKKLPGKDVREMSEVIRAEVSAFLHKMSRMGVE